MDDGHSSYNLSAAVSSLDQLELLMNRLRKVRGVSEVQRGSEIR